MKKRDITSSLLYLSTMAVLLQPTLSSCSNDLEDLAAGAGNKSGPATVEAIDASSTRAMHTVLTTFSLFSFDGVDEVLADNIVYTKDESTGTWSGDSPYYMSDMWDMYAYGVSPNISAVTDEEFTYDRSGFVYTNPTEDQTMLKVASRIEYYMDEVNNHLQLTFNDALYTLRFQAFSGFEDVSVKVKSVTVHNMPNKAKFTFSPKSESIGTWGLTAGNQYVNYTQELETAVHVTTTDFVDVTDSAFVFFPIEPEPWDDWMGETLEECEAAKHCYIEVKCQITEEKDGKTYYLWGYPSEQADATHPEYESILYAFDQFNNTAEWNMSYNGYYFLFMDNNGYDINGNSPITPHPESGGSSAFKVSSQIDFWLKVEEAMGGTADKWTDDADNNSVEIKM